jgi:hypothetical protein
VVGRVDGYLYVGYRRWDKPGAVRATGCGGGSVTARTVAHHAKEPYEETPEEKQDWEDCREYIIRQMELGTGYYDEEGDDDAY